MRWLLEGDDGGTDLQIRVKFSVGRDKVLTYDGS